MAKMNLKGVTRLAALLLLSCFILTGCSDDSGSESTEAGTDLSDADNGPPNNFGENSDFGDESGDVIDTPGGGADIDMTEGGEDFCTPGTTGCMGPLSVGTCNAEGTAFEEQSCPEGTGCLAGICTPFLCELGQKDGCKSQTSYWVCGESQTEYVEVECGGDLKCHEGECKDLFCKPNTSVCYGLSGFKECLPDGSAYSEPQLCAEGTTCQPSLGICVDACEANVKANVYLGCSYFAVDLDNIEGGATENVALVVTVPDDQTEDATITITDMASGAVLTPAQLVVPDMDIAPGTLETFLLPIDPATNGNPLNGSTLTTASFLINSTAPVTVHQFNPLNGDGVYTNDASLLLPSNLGGQEYLAMSWPHRIAEEDDGTVILRGFVTVIATEPGTTKVDVIARGRIAGGVGVPSMLPNQPHSFTLNQGQVLNLESDGDEGEDLTGTWIQSSQRVSVMSGHECANIPSGVSYCDHLEQQLFPVSTWGTQYAADSFKGRNENQFDLWRIIGGEDEVTVLTTPPVPGYEMFTLHKGTFVEFMTQESFIVEATGPVLLGHYMVGSNYPGYSVACTEGAIPSGIGDPALTLGVPTEQFLTKYTVLTPPGYVDNYVNIVRPAGVEIQIDGVAVSTLFTAIGESGYEIAQHPVEAGAHTITSSGGGIGITAYGYACDVSYAYPGGLQLQTLGQQ